MAKVPALVECLKGCGVMLDSYLGNTDFMGKTVLDIGPGDGFWAFEMERRGAIVTALELGESDRWDIVPRADAPDYRRAMQYAVQLSQADLIKSRDGLGSRIEVKRGSIYQAPAIHPTTQIALLGNVLRHVRDPLLALEKVASVVTERIIVTEEMQARRWFRSEPSLRLIPHPNHPASFSAWYEASPSFVVEVLKILGFKVMPPIYHRQRREGIPGASRAKRIRHFTCVGWR